MDTYATHTLRETQPRGNDSSLIQQRHWEKQDFKDLSLVESPVTRDPEATDQVMTISSSP